VKWSLLLFGLVAVAGAAAACEGLSPGDIFETSGGHCTLGFLVADASGLYFATAGHCLQLDEAATNPQHGEIGRAVFRHLEPDEGSMSDGRPGDDFALLRVDPSLHDKLNPKMCGWNGPTGIYTDTPGDGLVNLYGHSLVFGDAGALGLPTYRRQGVLLENDGDAFYFTAPSLMGDSGSAVLHEDGRAMGVLTHLLIGGTATNGGTHLERGFRLAAEAGFPQLRLVLMGEDPVAVLAELRAQAAGEPAPPPTTPASATPTPSASPSPANATRPATSTPPAPQANDSIVPAASNDEGANRTPFATPLVLVAALSLALAVRRRRV